MHSFFKSVLDGGDWSSSCLRHFTFSERAPHTRWRVLSPAVGVDAMEKGIIPCPCQESNRDSLVIQPIVWLLYWLCYRSSISCLWPVLRYQLTQECKCNWNTKTERGLCLCNVSGHRFPEIFHFILASILMKERFKGS